MLRLLFLAEDWVRWVYLWDDFNVALWMVLRRFNRIMVWALLLWDMVLVCLVFLLHLFFVNSKQNRLSYIFDWVSLKIYFSVLIFLNIRSILLYLLHKSFRFYDTLWFFLTRFITVIDFWLDWRLLHFDLNYLLFIFWWQRWYQWILALLYLITLITMNFFTVVFWNHSRHTFAVVEKWLFLLRLWGNNRWCLCLFSLICNFYSIYFLLFNQLFLNFHVDFLQTAFLIIHFKHTSFLTFFNFFFQRTFFLTEIIINSFL